MQNIIIYEKITIDSGEVNERNVQNQGKAVWIHLEKSQKLEHKFWSKWRKIGKKGIDKGKIVGPHSALSS